MTPGSAGRGLSGRADRRRFGAPAPAWRRSGLFLAVLLLSSLAQAGCRRAPEILTLATTTSLEDSGLLSDILPDFESRYHARVDVIAVGSGQALALGAAGDVDLILAHAPEQEQSFVAAGHGVGRRPIMYNDFLIVGPAADPAGVKGLTDAAAALRQIADRQALFISRGDDSGTHLREQALWAAAGLEPAGDWYRSVGQGMGATLTLADQADAYTLTDRGTFLSRGAQGLGLVRLVEGDGRLINLYSVILVNPARHPGVRAELAEAFAAWLTEPQTQAAIAAYRIQDQLLFAPNADSRCPPQCDVVDASYTPPPPPPFGLRAVLREAVRLILSADPVLWQIVRLSLWVSGIAVLLAAVLGIPAGAWLGLRHFPGSSWLTVFIYTGMGFPPVVVGLFVYLLLSRQGPLTGLDWLFTPSAMIMAQTILAVPLVLGVTMSSVRGVPEELRRQLRSLGATEWQVVWAVLAEARFGVIVGLVAGFGAAISEVGAVMLVGGNIHGQTRVLTTAILLETRRGNFDLALALGIILLGLAFLANLVAVRLQRD